MRTAVGVGIIAFLLAVGIASASTIFKSSNAETDDFCFGYAICQ